MMSPLKSASCVAVMFNYFDASSSGVLKPQIQNNDHTTSFHVSAHANFILFIIRIKGHKPAGESATWMMLTTRNFTYRSGSDMMKGIY